VKINCPVLFPRHVLYRTCFSISKESPFLIAFKRKESCRSQFWVFGGLLYKYNPNLVHIFYWTFCASILNLIFLMLLAQIITACLGNNKKHTLSRWSHESIFNYLNLNHKTNSLWVKNNKNLLFSNRQFIFLRLDWWNKQWFCHAAKWIPVTTARRVRGLRMAERSPIWRVAANILNYQSRTADKG